MKWVQVADDRAGLARFLRSHGKSTVTMPSSSVQGGARTVSIAALFASAFDQRLTLPEAHEAGEALLADLVGGADTVDETPGDAALERIAEEMADAVRQAKAATLAVAYVEEQIDAAQYALDAARRARGLIK